MGRASSRPPPVEADSGHDFLVAADVLAAQKTDLFHRPRGVFAPQMAVKLDDFRIAMPHPLPNLSFGRAAKKALRTDVVP